MWKLVKYDGFYSLKFNRTVEKPNVKTIEMIEVNDRFIAEYELRKLFARRADRDRPDILHLKPTDFEKFRNYSNAFDEERSAFCRSFTSSRLSKSNSSLRLDF